MLSSRPAALRFLSDREGGWVDDPRDPGGATMRGVTLAVYRDWCARNGRLAPSKDGLRAISDADWNTIMTGLYWAPVAGDLLPVGADLMVFDMGVNSGVGTSSRMLQEVLRVKQDGRIGLITAAAADDYPPAYLVGVLWHRFELYYRSLTTLFPTFGKGWLARNDARRDLALSLAK
jgi:lysozyme family protein